MLTQFSRTELLLGKEAMDKLANSKVAVFGVGGVGGYVCEALARSGVGSFDLIDDDKVCLTNINRQIIATRKTIGQYKAEVMRDRILEINPYHPLIVKLSEAMGDEALRLKVEEVARVLLDQAKIAEGEPISDPSFYAARISEYILKSF